MLPAAAGQLCALAGIQLNVVDKGTGRDVGERQRVARLDVRSRAGDDHVADLQAVRRDDIALLAVFILHKRDKRGTVRIVLQRRARLPAYPTFWRLKSMMRYFLRLPPPRWRTVILP